MKFKITLLLLLFRVFASCTDDKQSELEVVVCEDVFTYTDCIKTIIDDNCITCHNSSPNAFGPFPLETYAQVRDQAENGNLLNRISLPDGDAAIMPQTGRMPQSNIDAITAWANGGYQE